MVLILFSVSNGLEFWLANHTSIYKNYELKIFKNMGLLVEIFKNWPNDLLGTNVYKTLESCR